MAVLIACVSPLSEWLVFRFFKGRRIRFFLQVSIWTLKAGGSILVEGNYFQNSLCSSLNFS